MHKREGGYSSVVERSLCMREASGSNPDISTTIFFLFSRNPFAHLDRNNAMYIILHPLRSISTEMSYTN